MGWRGVSLEELVAEGNGVLAKGGNTISSEIMYWIGYIYRYWHYLKGEPSFKIYRQANMKTMRRNYMIFHTMDPELAIDDLIEIKKQKPKYRYMRKSP